MLVLSYSCKLYTSLNHLHNYKVIYIVYRFMYVNYVLILEYKDVVVTGKWLVIKSVFPVLLEKHFIIYQLGIYPQKISIQNDPNTFGE